MVDTDYRMYIESIDSIDDLNLPRYKKFAFNKDNYWDELLPYFYKDTPANISFHIENRDDKDIMYSDFKDQYDDLYVSGGRNISDNKSYKEEFEYFAPLYIDTDNIPKRFVILRVDGPGITRLTKDNFRAEVLNNMKFVKSFDLTKNTNLGYWLDRNFRSNELFPKSPIELDFRKLEFSKWNGIDYDSGGWCSKSFFLDDFFANENTFLDFDQTIFDGYKNNKVIFPNILNFSFLFDDTPATPKSLRKWSINRYYGFYLDDIEEITSVTPYNPPTLDPNGVQILDNNILKPIIITNASDYNPFKDKWDDNKEYWVEISGEFYKVERFLEDQPSSKTKTPNVNKVKKSIVYTDEEVVKQIYKYKIISDLNLSGKESLLNKRTIGIDSDNYLSGTDYTFNIDGFDSADLWFIEIDSKYHRLTKESSGKYKIVSDYAFEITSSYYKYWINQNDPSYTKYVDMDPNFIDNPVLFKVYRCKFSDIKDFDNSIISTDYARYEYEERTKISKTSEYKLYAIDYRIKSNPIEYDEYKYGGGVVNIPCSSEYNSTGELFSLKNDNNSGSYELNDLWSKNPNWCKWQYNNSVGAYDYPYRANNSLYVDDFNRTTNVLNISPDRSERNLDYFYTINSNSSSNIYEFQSLNIENNDSSGKIDLNFNFDIAKYLGFYTYSVGVDTITFNSCTQSSDYKDYFSYLFGKSNYSDSGSQYRNTNKYSVFNEGDSIINNSTLFRGIQFDIFNVDNVIDNDNYNKKSNNEYCGYKFSTLLSTNVNSYESNKYSLNQTYGENIDWTPSNITLTNITGFTYSPSGWKSIEEFKYSKSYVVGDLVVYEGFVFECILNNKIVDPKNNPFNQPAYWSGYVNEIFPYDTGYQSMTYSFYDSDYYITLSSGGTGDFWNPGSASVGYANGDYVIYKGEYFISLTQSNKSTPSSLEDKEVGNVKTKRSFWKSIDYDESLFAKKRVPLWVKGVTSSQAIDGNYYVCNKGGLYVGASYIFNSEPTESNLIHTFDVNNLPTNRSLSLYPVFLNNKYVFSSTETRTLDNGVTVYINNIHKNVLVHIYVNDQTIPYLNNCNRDLMYNEHSTKLTARNFMQYLNDMSKDYGYSDSLSYIIIDSDSNGGIVRKKYNRDNIKDLKVRLRAIGPDRLDVNLNSFYVSEVTINKNLVKSKRLLKDGNIDNISKLNYYNDNTLAIKFSKNVAGNKKVDNYHGLKNIMTNDIYRFSGYYSPLFYNIDLFKRYDYNDGSLVGNYKFDTSLSSFGLMKERIVSKVNRTGNILMFRNNKETKSIYPMIDEYGYTSVDYFIFKSTWDNGFYIECQNLPTNLSENDSESSKPKSIE